MTEKVDADRQRKIFAKNLNHYMERNGKSTADIAADLSFPFSTVSDWVHGKKYPRMDKVQAIADYFGILKSYLTEEELPPLTHPLSSIEKQPPAHGEEPLYPPEYDLLTQEDRELVDNMIRSLAKKKQTP